MVYFDHNATTPIDERVCQAMFPYLNQFYGNASALYRLGRIAKSALEAARAQVAQLVNVSAEQVIFTSGGTEANNLALHQLATGSKLTLSAVEHPSLMTPALAWQANGQQLTILNVDAEGHIDRGAVDAAALKKGDLLSLQLAHNETGVLQAVADYASKLRAKGVLVHTDATQAAGKIAVDFKQLQVNLLSLSSHKLYGPKGCGALIIEQGFELRPLIHGGGQENGYRSGTENIAALVGFGKAAELAATELASRRQHVLTLRNQLEQGLKSIPGGIIFAEHVERLPNTVLWGHPGLDGEMLVMQLDRKGFALSSGSACSSGGGKPSASLIAMGIAEALAKSALRISFGQQNTPDDVDNLIYALKTFAPA